MLDLLEIQYIWGNASLHASTNDPWPLKFFELFWTFGLTLENFYWKYMFDQKPFQEEKLQLKVFHYILITIKYHSRHISLFGCIHNSNWNPSDKTNSSFCFLCLWWMGLLLALFIWNEPVKKKYVCLQGYIHNILSRK